MGDTNERPKAKEPENIYAKMATVKTKLLGIKKGGVNEFSKYNYFELGDILPVLTPALKEERLYMKTQFFATEQVAKLIIINIDKPEEQIDFEIKFAECTLKGAHEIQNLGAAQTYTRRYLIMNAFDIAEADMVDSGAENREAKKDEKKQQPQANAAKPAAKADQPPQDKSGPPQTSQATDIPKLRREIWEKIKQLPEKDQAYWINACKGADAKKLVEINESLKEKQLEAIRAEIYSLLEKMPEAQAMDWLAVCDAANDSELIDILNQMKKQPAQNTTGKELAKQAAETPDELRDEDIPIY